MSPLAEFRAALDRPDLPAHLRAGLIGDDVMIDGPFGPKQLLYADYVASGRALRQVEDFVLTKVLPYYANTHTEASFVGAWSSRLRESARAEITRITGAGPECSVVFAGAGSTAGLNRIVGLLDLAGITAAGGRAVVLLGPYEHHSNLLPWRESGAEVREIPEAAAGGPCLVSLERELRAAAGVDLVVGAFGVASNVTGIVTDTEAITSLLRRHGALAVWDYGCAAPYLPVAMGSGASAKDAIVFSAHKFPGGPGASGVMVVRDTIVRRSTPTLPGGGTVSFVSPWDHAYAADLSAREEGGTPNVVGDIRAALVLLIKEALGAEWLAERQAVLRARALERWSDNPALDLLGQIPGAPTLPIFSFRVRRRDGGHIHHQLFTRMLSDLKGVQARGGCACAGSYAHRLLGIDRAASASILQALRAGDEIEKPGWVRLNLSPLLSDAKADRIIDAVDELARTAEMHARRYVADPVTARFVTVGA